MRTSFKRIGAACAALAFFALPACSDGPASTGSVEILHWWKQGGEADAISATDSAEAVPVMPRR